MRAVFTCMCELLLMGLASSCSQGKEIRLRVDPMESGISEFLTVDNSGEAQFFLYDRYQLVVHSRHAGKLDPSLRTGIFNLSPALQGSLRTSSWGQLGVTQGDMFSLTIGEGTDPARSSVGIIQDAPSALQNYLRRLRELGRGLPSAELAPAYLEARVIDLNRRAALERRGQVFRKPEEVPELRSLLELCARRPGEFLALSKSQQLLLVGRGQPAWEYMRFGTIAAQLTLYSSGGPQPSSKEKK